MINHVQDFQRHTRNIYLGGAALTYAEDFETSRVYQTIPLSLTRLINVPRQISALHINYTLSVSVFIPHRRHLNIKSSNLYARQRAAIL